MRDTKKKIKKSANQDSSSDVHERKFNESELTIINPGGQSLLPQGLWA